MFRLRPHEPTDFQPNSTMATVDEPQKHGITVLENVSVEELKPYIDWTPFFQTWELHGRYPDIFNDAKFGNEAKKLFDDARVLLDL